ncbi:MAG: PAS domain-containing sensor histidine kinase, partial [Gammaproteobacteria bacterium]
DAFKKRAESMLAKTKADLSRISKEDIQQLIHDFQVYLIELELHNEKLQRTEHELARSQKRYAKLYDFAPIGYLTLNKEGTIVESNLTTARSLGISRLELIGRKLTDFIYADDVELYTDYLDHFTKHLYKQSLELRLKKANGLLLEVELQGTVNYNNNDETEIWLAVVEANQCRPVRQSIDSLNQQLENKLNGNSTDMIAINRELQNHIRELAHSRHELEEREARLNSIFNAAVEGIITIDEYGFIVCVNKAITHIFGYSENEIIGENISLLLPHLCSNDKSYFLDYLFNNKTSIVGQVRELEGKHKCGVIIPIDLSIAEFHIDNKYYFTGIIRDVTERKLKEQKDKEHLNELAHVTRLGLMGEMASGIAHEVNQPITAVANYTQACLHYLRTGKPDVFKLAETMEKANDQALKAGQIIRRMRDFVRSRKMLRTIVKINGLVKEAVSLCEADCKQQGINCKLELSQNLPDVFVDSVHIEQVILNLIRNSVEALNTLPQDSQKLLVVQTYLNEENEIEVRIKDNGPGLNDAQKLEISKPFFTTKESGMGMGLSISRSIVEAHNGVLRFNSKKEKGSTFYFTLPVVKGAS